MKAYLNKEISQVNTDDAKQDEVVKRMGKEMNVLQQQTEKNKARVIDFILDNALDVDLTIPDVVKGQFAAKLGASK